MLALPFFLFNLKIAFIVFSPYYKCKACSLTKKKISRDRQKEECTCKPSSWDASSRPHFQTLSHTWHMYKHVHAHVYMSIMIPALSGLGCSSVYCLPSPPPQSQEIHTPMQTAKPIPCAGSGFNPCHVVAHSALLATRR